MALSKKQAINKVVPLEKFARLREKFLPANLKTKTQRSAHIQEIIAKPHEEIKALAKIESKRAMVWTTRWIAAAYYVAEDRMTLKDIAIKVDVPFGRLKRYLRQKGEFTDKVEELRAKIIEKIKSIGAANRDVRISVLDELHGKLREIYQQRAEKYKNRKHPGVNTGLMIRTVKAVGHGRDQKIIRGWDVDTPLIKEIREIEVQIAKECGQWTDKSESANLIVVREYKGASPDSV